MKLRASNKQKPKNYYSDDFLFGDAKGIIPSSPSESDSDPGGFSQSLGHISDHTKRLSISLIFENKIGALLGALKIYKNNSLNIVHINSEPCPAQPDCFLISTKVEAPFELTDLDYLELQLGRVARNPQIGIELEDDSFSVASHQLLNRSGSRKKKRTESRRTFDERSTASDIKRERSCQYANASLSIMSSEKRRRDSGGKGRRERKRKPTKASKPRVPGPSQQVSTQDGSILEERPGVPAISEGAPWGELNEEAVANAVNSTTIFGQNPAADAMEFFHDFIPPSSVEVFLDAGKLPDDKVAKSEIDSASRLGDFNDFPGSYNNDENLSEFGLVDGRAAESFFGDGDNGSDVTSFANQSDARIRSPSSRNSRTRSSRALYSASPDANDDEENSFYDDDLDHDSVSAVGSVEQKSELGEGSGRRLSARIRSQAKQAAAKNRAKVAADRKSGSGLAGSANRTVKKSVGKSSNRFQSDGTCDTWDGEYSENCSNEDFVSPSTSSTRNRPKSAKRRSTPRKRSSTAKSRNRKRSDRNRSRRRDRDKYPRAPVRNGQIQELLDRMLECVTECADSGKTPPTTLANYRRPPKYALGEKTFRKCQYCDFVDDFRYVNKHIQTCHPEAPEYQCKDCGKSYWNLRSLNTHTDAVHTRGGWATYKRRYKPQRKPRAKPDAKCPYCDLTFSGMYIERHIRNQHTHPNERKTFLCTVCGKVFSDDSKYKRHVLAHEGIVDRFYCQFCGKCFTRASNVRTHENSVHHKVRQHICGICGAGYCLRNGLESHMVKVHGETPSGVKFPNWRRKLPTNYVNQNLGGVPPEGAAILDAEAADDVPVKAMIRAPITAEKVDLLKLIKEQNLGSKKPDKSASTSLEEPPSGLDLVRGRQQPPAQDTILNNFDFVSRNQLMPSVSDRNNHQDGDLGTHLMDVAHNSTFSGSNGCKRPKRSASRGRSPKNSCNFMQSIGSSSVHADVATTSNDDAGGKITALTAKKFKPDLNERNLSAPTVTVPISSDTHRDTSQIDLNASLQNRIQFPIAQQHAEIVHNRTQPASIPANLFRGDASAPGKGSAITTTLAVSKSHEQQLQPPFMQQYQQLSQQQQQQLQFVQQQFQQQRQPSHGGLPAPPVSFSVNPEAGCNVDQLFLTTNPPSTDQNHESMLVSVGSYLTSGGDGVSTSLSPGGIWATLTPTGSLGSQEFAVQNNPLPPGSDPATLRNQATIHGLGGNQFHSAQLAGLTGLNFGQQLPAGQFRSPDAGNSVGLASEAQYVLGNMNTAGPTTTSNQTGFPSHGIWHS